MTDHLVFFHQTYPAQFGPITQFLLKNYDVKISFFSEFMGKPLHPGVVHYPYKSDTMHTPENPYFFSRYFEQECRSVYGVYKALEAAKIDNPDRFIGHVGFGNLTFLHVAAPDIPTVGFFEIFYDPFDPETYSRPGFPIPKENILRMPLRNALQLVELQYCTKGYSPTPYQRSTYPQEYQYKLETIFDGIHTDLYSPGEVTDKTELPITWPKDKKIVTYVARGLELFRGFDVFMEVAHKICQQRDDIHFVIAGRESTHYGPEAIHLKDKSFKSYVMEKRNYDLSRFHFLEWISEPALVDLYRLSDCHFYWTVPFTLSWSFFQSLSTGVIPVASDSRPVRDLIRHGENGLMVGPDDIDGFVEAICDVVDNPEKYKPYRKAARETILANYSVDVCLPRLAEFMLSNEHPQMPQAAQPSLAV